jgi:hypothetical protein
MTNSGLPPRRHRRRVAARVGAAGTDWGEGIVAEASVRLTVPPGRIRTALHAAQHLSDTELAVIERLADFAASGASAARRRAVAEGLTRALASLTPARGADPLAPTDEPLDEATAAESVLQSELEIHARRRALLQRCVGAAEACVRTGRSRQALERLRREGRVLALRVGNQWRYPDWQFEPDASGGVVPGLAEVLHHLHLSPAGAALWLTQAAPALDDRPPIEALRRRQRDAVVRLAAEQGHMP